MRDRLPFRRFGRWFFVHGGRVVGPYETRTAAVSDHRRLRWLERNNNVQWYVTSESEVRYGRTAT